MKREELIRSKEYHLAGLQLSLYRTIEAYMETERISRSELANRLGVTKSYVSQILNGDFNHKLEKFIELCLATNTVPILTLIPIDKYIEDDNKKRGELSNQHYFVKRDASLLKINAPYHISIENEFPDREFSVQIKTGSTIIGEEVNL